MKTFYTLPLLLFLIACGQPATLNWMSDAEAAFSRSATRDEPVLTYLYTDWCTYCKQMEATTFQEQEVIEGLTEDYVLLKLNAEKDPEGIRLRDEFQVTVYPTFLIMNFEEQEIDRVQGYVPPEKFLASLENRLESPDAFIRVARRAEENPENVEAQYTLAQKYLERNQAGPASRQLMTVLELDPDNQAGHSDDSLYRLAEILAGQDANDDAILAVETLRKRYPESPALADGTLLQAELLIEQGKKPKALALLKKFLEKYPAHESASRVREYINQSSSVAPAASHGN